MGQFGTYQTLRLLPHVVRSGKGVRPPRPSPGGGGGGENISENEVTLCTGVWTIGRGRLIRVSFFVVVLFSVVPCFVAFFVGWCLTNRAKTNFQLFCILSRPKFNTMYKTLVGKAGKIQAKMAQAWKKLTEKEMAFYNKQAEKDKVRHDSELARSVGVIEEYIIARKEKVLWSKKKR